MCVERYFQMDYLEHNYVVQCTFVNRYITYIYRLIPPYLCNFWNFPPLAQKCLLLHVVSSRTYGSRTWRHQRTSVWRQYMTFRHRHRRRKRQIQHQILQRHHIQQPKNNNKNPNYYIPEKTISNYFFPKFWDYQAENRITKNILLWDKWYVEPQATH